MLRGHHISQNVEVEKGGDFGEDLCMERTSIMITA